MEFKEYIPASLSGIVDLIWEHVMPFPGSYTILPSGKVELIFPLHPITDLLAAKITKQENPMNNYNCFLSGLHTRPLNMTFEKFHVFGIQMKPVAVKALFGMPLSEIRDYFVEAKIVFGSINRMEDMVNSSNSFEERAKWFESFLYQRIHENADLHMAIKLEKAIGKHLTKKTHEPTIRIEEMLGYSRTQTYRIFNEWFGISAHAYQKLMQFIQSVDMLHHENIKLMDIGFNNGYYDQAHFIHTFHKFADMTPGAYRQRMTAVPGQLFASFH